MAIPKIACTTRADKLTKTGRGVREANTPAPVAGMKNNHGTTALTAPNNKPSASDRGIPYLGICFGAQLLAEVLGGRTIKAERMEVGMIEFDASAACPAAPGPWFSWHNDIVELPDDVEILARTEIAPQVFKAGNSLGVQFHPEVTKELMEEWLRVGGDELTGNFTADEFRQEWDAKGRYAQAHGRELIDWFLTVEPVAV